MSNLPKDNSALSKIGMRDLRSTLTASLRRAETGERIVITIGGKPTAILGPLEPTAQSSLDTLYAAGLAIPPRTSIPGRRGTTPPPSTLPVDIRLADVLADIRGR
ncbi:MAG: hypothetical protein V3V01_02390 [Acidimicrobiales bacterium]